MTNGTNDDVPKIVASVMVTVPTLTLRTGIAFLRMKRQVRRSSKAFRRSLEENGVPSGAAADLSHQYETDLSIRKMIKGLTPTVTKEVRADASSQIQSIRSMVL